MKHSACLAAFLLVTQGCASNNGLSDDELVGHFKSLPVTNASCGVLFVGSTATFVDASSHGEISVVIPCMNDQSTKGKSGLETHLIADRTYHIKVSKTQPKGLCCFTQATDLWFISGIKEVQ
jgi:hypothetical protein